MERKELLKLFYLMSAVVWGVISLPNTVLATSIQNLDGLESITIFEVTGTINPLTYLVNAPELNQKFSSINATNNDFGTDARTEYYDVFYSDSAGNFDPRGEYLTIQAAFDLANPFGGGKLTRL